MKNLDPLAGVAAFLSVAETLSFSRTGKLLSMSRATVSAQVVELEKRLGIRLLQRSTRTVTLTEAGAAYVQAMSGVLPQVREAERAATSFQKDAVGRIRISSAPDLGPDHLVPAIAKFLDLNPGISIELDLSLDTVNLIDEKFDLAIRGTISVDPNVITRQLGTSPVVVCASPAYIERHGAPDHPDALSSHSCLHFSKLRWGRLWRFTREGVDAHVPIEPKLECNDGRSLLAAAVAGMGIALEPTFVVGPAIREEKLVRVLEDWEITTVPVHAVYPANRHIAVKVKTFVSFLAAHLADHPDLRQTSA